MNWKLKFQIASSIVITFIVGVTFGIYLASLFIGDFIPELAR
jgi:hypothetical protein